MPLGIFFITITCTVICAVQYYILFSTDLYLIFFPLDNFFYDTIPTLQQIIILKVTNQMFGICGFIANSLLISV